LNHESVIKSFHFAFHGKIRRNRSHGIPLLWSLCLVFRSGKGQCIERTRSALYLEDVGYLLPVRTFEVNYKRPAHYDDDLEIRTTIREFNGIKILFYFETYRLSELLNKAKVELVFVNKSTLRPCEAPENVKEILIQATTRP